MNREKMYAFIGGDLRQNYLYHRLTAAGFDCVTYRMLPDKSRLAPEASSLEDALQYATHILCPMPFSKNNPIDTNEFPAMLTTGQTVYGGSVPAHLIAALTDAGITCYDYMKAETLTQFNTIATAEGVLAEAITDYPGNIHGSKTLVLGYGRCGKTLAARLRGLCANVCIGARKDTALAEADSMGYQSVKIADLHEKIYDYDLIFNTIPERILTAPVLSSMKQGSYIFDIASAPGGTDFDAAENLGLHAGLYGALPGRYAPAASADALCEFIMKTSNNVS